MNQFSVEAFMKYLDEYIDAGRCFMRDFRNDESYDKATNDTMLQVFNLLTNEEITIFISTIIADYIDTYKPAA